MIVTALWLRRCSSSSWKARTESLSTTVQSMSFATQATTSTTKKRSLALSVHFYQPDLGMNDYEILSRATAFLLGVDAPDTTTDTTTNNPYAHLDIAEQQRQLKQYKRQHNGMSPAGGPKGRKVMDMSWLEFVPKEVRPQVHVVCSSHVLAPFLWNDYYPQDWLRQVRPEHCTYSLEVYETTNTTTTTDDLSAPQEPIAKLALGKQAQPFHHPEGRDIALLHFEDEASSLKLLRQLGVQPLYLRDPDKLYQKGEDLIFDGYVVREPNAADAATYQQPKGTDTEKEDDDDEDLRIFYPYVSTGHLAFHTDDRFFATTPEPLPEGLCGAPVVDVDGDLCGTVEGIVPIDHKDKRLAGSAAFMPSYMMQAFVDYVERGLLEQMMPKDLFQMVVTAKKTNSIGGGVFQADGKGNYEESDWEQAYDTILDNLKKRYSPDEVQAILKTVERERDEVLEIMDKEGGELDEVMQRVRQKTLQIRDMIHDQYMKEQSSEGERKST